MHYLCMEHCISIMAEALKTLAQGNSINPLRSVMRFPTGKGLLGLMPAYLDQPAITGMKLITVLPGNHGIQYDSHQVFVILFEVEHGCPVALVEASSITAIRTAAVSAVATDLLGREDSKTLTILGSGVQAGTHINAIGACVRNCRGLDTEAVLKSRLYVDLMESAMNEAGDFLIPRQEGALDDDHIVGELGDLLLGKVKGRAAENEITLFKGLGIGIEDLAVPYYVYEQAVQSNAGTCINI